MSYKWIGVIAVIAGCGGVGFRMAFQCRQHEKTIRQLILALEYMENELQYKMTPLPELCHHTAQHTTGEIKALLEAMYQELQSQVAPEAGYCMNAAISKLRHLDGTAAGLMKELGSAMGVFDLSGQLCAMAAIRQEAEQELAQTRKGQEERTRSYQTLGLCAGAALAILFL